MAGDGVIVKIEGLDDLRATLRALPDKLRRRALRNALAAGARVVRDAARLRAPVLRTSTYSGASAIRRGVRAPGTVRRAIAVRTSKAARRAGDVGVFVNVRPAKGAARGATKPTDPFYWRFLEFGTQRSRPFSFLQQAAGALQRALQIFQAQLGPQVAKLNITPKDPL